MTQISYINGPRTRNWLKQSLGNYHYLPGEPSIAGIGESEKFKDVGVEDITSVVGIAKSVLQIGAGMFASCSGNTCNNQPPKKCYEDTLKARKKDGLGDEFKVKFTAFMIRIRENNGYPNIKVDECDKNKDGARLKEAVFMASKNVQGENYSISQKWVDKAREQLGKKQQEKENGGGSNGGNNNGGNNNGGGITQSGFFGGNTLKTLLTLGIFTGAASVGINAYKNSK